MKSNTEMEQLDQEIDKWFEELEADLENAPVQESKVDLDRKILDDFHGFAPTIDDKYNGELPSITPKAQIFISQNLEENQYFRFGVEGGGCSGFNYLFDVDKTVNEDDIKFSESPPALIDEMSLKYLFGSEIDLYTEVMNKMLKVTNPGAKESSGCGPRFPFDEV